MEKKHRISLFIVALLIKKIFIKNVLFIAELWFYTRLRKPSCSDKQVCWALKS